MRNLLFAIDRNICAKTPILCITWLLLFFITACKDAGEIQNEMLYGKWEISKAERNGKETGYLRNGYFIFNENGTMTLNITGEDERGNFILENKKVVMEGEKSFDIQSLQNDSLIMKYTTSPQSQFLFYMVKKNDDAQ